MYQVPATAPPGGTSYLLWYQVPVTGSYQVRICHAYVCTPKYKVLYVRGNVPVTSTRYYVYLLRVKGIIIVTGTCTEYEHFTSTRYAPVTSTRYPVPYLLRVPGIIYTCYEYQVLYMPVTGTEYEPVTSTRYAPVTRTRYQVPHLLRVPGVCFAPQLSKQALPVRK